MGAAHDDFEDWQGEHPVLDGLLKMATWPLVGLVWLCTRDLKETQVSTFRDSISTMSKRIHTMAKEKGWWETKRSPLELHMLVVSEIAEATEEARRGTPPIYQTQISASGGGEIQVLPTGGGWNVTLKPEGELIELADAVIRIFDICEERGWDLGAAIEMKVGYNASRPHRHGGKLY